MLDFGLGFFTTEAPAGELKICDKVEAQILKKAFGAAGNHEV